MERRIAVSTALVLIGACHGAHTPTTCHQKYEVQTHKPAHYEVCMSRWRAWMERQEQRANARRPQVVVVHTPAPAPTPVASPPAMACTPVDGGFFCVPATGTGGNPY